MEKRKILGLSLLGAGTASLGLGVYTIVNAAILNHKTDETKANESTTVNSVVNNVYGSTEESAKDMGMAAGLLAGAAAIGALIMFTTGGILLSPKGIKLQQMKLAKIGLISSGIIAIGAPILGAVSVGLYHTPTVQQAKQFIDFSKEFENVFMGNVNQVETKARDMLEKAGWMDFAKMLTDIKDNSSLIKLGEAFKTTEPAEYYKQHFLVASNLYVLAGSSTLDSFSMLPSLTSANFYKTFDWGTTNYKTKLDKVKTIRDTFVDKDVKIEVESGKPSVTANTVILDKLEEAAVKEAAKKSVVWFKDRMHKYHSDFGTKATDEVIALTLSKLAYVSGNNNMEITLGKNKTNDNITFTPAEDDDNLIKRSIIPAKLSHFKELSGIIADANGNFILKNKLTSVIGIEELVDKYKANWKSDPLGYVFTNDEVGTDIIDETSIQNINIAYSKEWLGTYFKDGHKLHIKNVVNMTDFNKLKGSIGTFMISNIGNLSTLAPLGSGALVSKIIDSFKTTHTDLTQSKSSYFLQLKLSLAKNYVQQVMNEIGNTLTNSPDDIYK